MQIRPCALLASLFLACRIVPAPEQVTRFADLLEPTFQELIAFEGETTSVSGRPMGAADFTASVEQRLGRAVTPAKRGRKPKGAKGDN